MEPFSNGRSKCVYAIKRVELSEGAWAVSSVGFTEGAIQCGVYRRYILCEQVFPFTSYCEIMFSAVDSSPCLHQGVWGGMFVEKFQIVTKSLTCLYFFILNCVFGNVYMWLQLLESRRADQAPGAGVMGAVNSNVGAGNWARILWSNSKCSTPLSCLPSTTSPSFYGFIQTLPDIKTNWGCGEGGNNVDPTPWDSNSACSAWDHGVSPRDFYAIQDLAGVICNPSPGTGDPRTCTLGKYLLATLLSFLGDFLLHSLSMDRQLVL